MKYTNTVKIITKDGCPYCIKAKTFLDDKGINFETEKLDKNDEGYVSRRDELIEATNHKTFPWVFVGKHFIGGYTDLTRSYDTFLLHDKLKEIGIEIPIDEEF
eukprot:maker-scaffold_33-snap-gene-1.47-mRNA-1 protein AED:0.02 eAED:0.02 QI:159/1/1/1/1/1/3/105/102